MLSRVAESIYWMSRYLERAENIARYIDVHSNLTLDTPGMARNNWSALLRVTGEYREFTERYAEESPANIIRFLAFDPSYANSLVGSMNQARENARSIREVISPELWQQINSLYHMLRTDPPDPDRSSQDLYSFFNQVKLMGLSFGGIVNDTMAHTEGWQWFRAGRLIERADKTSRILDVKYFTLLPSSEDVGAPIDQIQWAGLLKSTSAQEVYRTRYGEISPRNIARFLILDRDFPRSILHCLNRADEAVRGVLGTYPNHFQNPAEQFLGQMCSELAYTTIDRIMETGLHEWVDTLQSNLNRVGLAIHEVYFSA